MSSETERGEREWEEGRERERERRRGQSCYVTFEEKLGQWGGMGPGGHGRGGPRSGVGHAWQGGYGEWQLTPELRSRKLRA